MDLLNLSKISVLEVPEQVFMALELLFYRSGREKVCPTHKEQNISIQIWSTKISIPQLEDNMFAKLKHFSIEQHYCKMKDPVTSIVQCECENIYITM